MISENIITQVV